MNAIEFHKARRMFVLACRTLILAPKNDERTHHAWLTDLFGVTPATWLIQNCTRGYILNGRMMCYKGIDFSAEVDKSDVKYLFEEMPERIAEIGLGAVPGPNQPWEPKELHRVASCVWLWELGG